MLWVVDYKRERDGKRKGVDLVKSSQEILFLFLFLKWNMFCSENFALACHMIPKMNWISIEWCFPSWKRIVSEMSSCGVWALSKLILTLILIEYEIWEASNVMVKYYLSSEITLIYDNFNHFIIVTASRIFPSHTHEVLGPKFQTRESAMPRSDWHLEQCEDPHVLSSTSTISWF